MCIYDILYICLYVYVYIYIYRYTCVCVCDVCVCVRVHLFIYLFIIILCVCMYIYIYKHRNPVQRGPKLNGSNTKPGNWGDEAIAALRQLTSFCTRTNTLARAPVHDASLMLPHHDLCMV